MITRTRHKRDGWFSVLRRLRKSHASSPEFLDEAGFVLAINKERCRSERRELTFCIILFDVDGMTRRESAACHTDLACRFRRRVRITDEIGVFRDSLALLLPETIPSQAARVANNLTEIALERGIEVSTEIFAYPEIDGNQLAANEPGNTGIVEIDVAESSEFEKDEPLNGETDAELNSPPDGTTTAGDPDQMPSDKTKNVVEVRRLDTSIATPLWKRLTDIVGASTGLIMLSPVFLITTLAVRLNSQGPAFFTQWREGKDGQLFKIYKFRTMRLGAEEEKSVFRKLNEQDGPAFKIRNDPRLTSIGRYLRKSCIDELPQLINVLKGEMSLVGPRPLPVDESLNCSPWHRRRLDVLPGMTCFWQIDGGREITFDDWMRMDLDYVRQLSFRTDLSLIFRTAVVTILHRGSV